MPNAIFFVIHGQEIPSISTILAALPPPLFIREQSKRGVSITMPVSATLQVWCVDNSDRVYAHTPIRSM